MKKRGGVLRVGVIPQCTLCSENAKGCGSYVSLHLTYLVGGFFIGAFYLFARPCRV